MIDAILRLFLLFMIIMPAIVYAEGSIILKSGKKVVGNILEKTDKYIKIDSDGTALTFYRDEIERIEDEAPWTGKEAHSDEEWNNKVEADYGKKQSLNPKGMELLEAVQSAKGTDVIQQLIKDGADVNGLAGIYGLENTPLAAAANKGNIDAVKVLVENGADVNKPGFMGWPPLAHAVNNGHIDIVRYLLDKGADINFSSPMGGSLIILAEKFPEIQRLLREKGAK